MSLRHYFFTIVGLCLFSPLQAMHATHVQIAQQTPLQVSLLDILNADPAVIISTTSLDDSTIDTAGDTLASLIATAVGNNAINATTIDGSGNTALHLAAQIDNTALVTALLQNGANIFAMNAATPQQIPIDLVTNTTSNTYAILANTASLFSSQADLQSITVYAASDGSPVTPTDTSAAGIITSLINNGAVVQASNTDGKTPLLKAIQNNFTDAISALIINGATATEQDSAGNTPLMAALQAAQMNIADALLTSTPTLGIGDAVGVNIPNDAGDTPLLLAVNNKLTAIISKLIKAGANLETKDSNNQTVLLIASNNNSNDIITTLTAKGANKEIEDNLGNTPLLIAAKKGYFNSVAALLTAGANATAQDANGNTALLLAIKSNFYSVVTALLTDSPTKEIGTKVGVNIADNNGETPLLLASLKNLKTMIKPLLDAGASPTTQDVDGNTPLLVAIQDNSIDDALTLLTENPNTDIGVQIGVNMVDKAGDTPLLLATRKNITTLIKPLLDAGANASVQDALGNTALLLAVKAQAQDICTIFLTSSPTTEIGVSLGVNLANTTGDTPLLVAANTKFGAVIPALIKAGANLEVKNSNGQTPLLVATNNGFIDVATALITLGADMLATDVTGNTPLLLALKKGYSDIAIQLLNSMKNSNGLNLANKAGETPIFIALAQQKTDLLTKLIAAGASARNQDADKNTPLLLTLKNYYAAETPQMPAYADIIKTLLDEAKIGIDIGINTANADGMIPFSFVIGKKDISVLKALITAGANVNAQDSDGNTPLLLTLAINNEDDFWPDASTELLNQPGIDVTIANKNGVTPLHLVRTADMCKQMISKNANIRATNDKGETPLHKAYNAEIAALLIKVGADVNAQTKNGDTLLIYAIAQGKKDIWTLLLAPQQQQGAGAFTKAKPKPTPPVAPIALHPDLGTDVKIANLEGLTPLHFAAFTSGELTKQLLSFGASATATAWEGLTPLHFAALGNNLTACQALLSPASTTAKKAAAKPSTPKIDINNPSTLYGLTPLILATIASNVISRYPAVAAMINQDLQASMEKKATNDENPMSAMTKQLMQDNVAICSLLITASKNAVTSKTIQGFTPLHFAVASHNPDLCTLLIKNGASLQSTAILGITPMHIFSLASGIDLVAQDMMQEMTGAEYAADISFENLAVGSVLFKAGGTLNTQLMQMPTLQSLISSLTLSDLPILAAAVGGVTWLFQPSKKDDSDSENLKERKAMKFFGSASNLKDKVVKLKKKVVDIFARTSQNEFAKNLIETRSLISNFFEPEEQLQAISQEEWAILSATQP